MNNEGGSNWPRISNDRTNNKQQTMGSQGGAGETGIGHGTAVQNNKKGGGQSFITREIAEQLQAIATYFLWDVLSADLLEEETNLVLSQIWSLILITRKKESMSLS